MTRSAQACVLGALWLLSAPAFATINYINGPATADIGDMATIKVPEGWRFVPKESMKEFDESSQNLYSEDELGCLLAPSGSTGGLWAFFQFEDVGYIKDAASEKLDADAMWKTMKENDQEANEVRREKGYPTSTMGSWKIPPQYNPQNQRLEWAYSFSISGNGGETINYNTRILGRKGVMRVTVVPMGSLDDSLPVFSDCLAGYDFKDGNRYAQFVDGDKLAKVGLAALVVGGVGAAALSTGLLAKLWKLIVLAVVGIASAIKKLFNKLMGRPDEEAAPAGIPDKAPIPNVVRPADREDGPPKAAPPPIARSEAQPRLED